MKLIKLKPVLVWGIGALVFVNLLYISIVALAGDITKLGGVYIGVSQDLYQGAVYGWDSDCARPTCDQPGDKTRYGIVGRK
jgi:hypothetical protein